MQKDRRSAARNGLFLALLLGAFATTTFQGCGDSSSPLLDRNSPEFKEQMKRSADAYIQREKDAKDAKKARRRPGR